MVATSKAVRVFTFWLPARLLNCQTHLIPFLLFRLNPMTVLGGNLFLVAYHSPGRIVSYKGNVSVECGDRIQPIKQKKNQAALEIQQTGLVARMSKVGLP